MNVLLFIGSALCSDAFLLRKRAGTQALTTTARAVDALDYKVLEKKSIKREATVDCICPLKKFWHWRINECVDQGPWAYECGFFPAEHHDKVCADNLKCEPLKNTNTTYGGFEGEDGHAHPASCQKCAAEDKCKTGEERHSENCLKEYVLSGDACQTVQVTAKGVKAKAKVTEKVTAKATATAKAKATAEETASATEGEHTAEATGKAEAEAEHTAEVEKTGEATKEAEATEDGVAEGKACVTVAEVKEHMKLKDVPKMPAVLSSQVVAKGDELAFDRAYAKALEAAEKAGLINAEEAAKAVATAEAREHAGMSAKAAAEEAAAWAAEAGASAEAQKKASEKAMASAKTAAGNSAAATAAKSAKAKAEADAAAAAAKAAGAGDQAAADNAKAKADAAASAAAAAENAKAANAAIGDYLNAPATEKEVKITTAKPTNAPRKMSPADIAAGLP